MKRYVGVVLGVCAMVLGAGQSARAEKSLAFHAGTFDVFDENYVAVGLELRGDNLHMGLRPVVGAMVDGDKDIYGYGGLVWDVPLSDKFYLTPGLAVGAYHDGGGLDLGGALEFRSSIEGTYALESGSRIGITLDHISNAGLHDKNPGAETLSFTWIMPFSALK